MFANIIAMFGLFLGIIYTYAIVIRIPYVKEAGVKISFQQQFMAALGWTMFVSAMWIF